MTRFLQDRETDDAIHFGFDAYSDALASTVTDQALKTPFTVAIYGDWGSGKTSLMKTVGRKIENDPKAKCKTIWFNAWKYEKSEQPLWTTFLIAVLSEVSEMAGNAGLKEKLRGIGQKFSIIGSQVLLSRVTGLGLSDLKELASTFQSNTREIKTLRDELNEAIRTALSADEQRYERIVIFIDDLDRCLPDRVVEVFEAIKLFLDCERCVFVLGLTRGK